MLCRDSESQSASVDMVVGIYMGRNFVARAAALQYMPRLPALTVLDCECDYRADAKFNLAAERPSGGRAGKRIVYTRPAVCRRRTFDLYARASGTKYMEYVGKARVQYGLAFNEKNLEVLVVRCKEGIYLPEGFVVCLKESMLYLVSSLLTVASLSNWA